MGRNLNPPTAAIGDIRGNISLLKGGTGKANAVEAVEALGGMSVSKFNIPLGVARLGVDGKIPENQLDVSAITANVALSGPNSLYASQVAQYTITNFDTKTDYIATITAGTVSISGRVVTVTAPATIGNITLVINNRSIVINVGLVRPLRPVLAVAASNNNIIATAILTSSAYAAMQGNATHISSDWEIATNLNFSNIVKSSYVDAVNKVSYTADSLAMNTMFYARTRHKDSNNAVSDWSSVIAFISEDTLSTITEEAKLTANVVHEVARFGSSVSISSDGMRVAVGSIADNNAPSPGDVLNTGSVYVFLRTGSSWTQEAKLTASDKEVADQFGSSVAITSDGSRVVVGARTEDPSGINGAGSIYVYLRVNNNWTQEAKLTATSPAINENLGVSVAINADGTRLIAGASGTTSTQGSAYIFLRTDVTWTQEAKLAASEPTLGRLFGAAVAIAGDGSRVVVSANRSNPTSISDAGAAYVFLRTGTSWAQEVKITANDKAVDDRLGMSIAMSSDGARIAIGATGVDTNFNAVGAVYIFLRSGVTWNQEAKMMASDNIDGISFGVSVSINTDGSKVIAGSELIDAGRGAAYVFSRTGISWTEEAKLTPNDAAVSDNFGGAVSISGDGFTMIIGASNEDPGNINMAGSAYIFS